MHLPFFVQFADDDTFLLVHLVEGIAHEAAAVLDFLRPLLRFLGPVEMAQGGVIVFLKNRIADAVIAADGKGPF